MITFEALTSIDMFVFHFVAIAPFFAEIYSIRYLTLKIQGQGHGQGQTWWSHLKPRVQSMYLLFVPWQSDHFLLTYSQFDIWPLIIQGQGHGQVQTRWSHLQPRVQSMCLLFVSWQSDHFWLRYSQFDIWPWKLKVKVTTKIAQNLLS